MTKKLFLIALITFASTLFIACSHNPTDENINSPQKNQEENTKLPENDINNNANAIPKNNLPDVKDSNISINEIQVVGSEFKFVPNNISVKSGEQVKITFKNDGDYPHDLVFRGIDVATDKISSGEEFVIEFTAPESGTYEFYCSVAGHEDLGMKGLMTVK